MNLGTSARRTGSLALLLGVTAVTLAAPAGASPVPRLGGACAPDEGVTVVVDLTDLGGDLVVSCADGDPASGREALEAAGFVPTDSTPGMICAIDSLPDPCPEEFDGSFWSYWNAEPDGQWTSYMVGADEADPAPGTLEGWRYFDGSAGPNIMPAEAVAVAAERAEVTATSADVTDDTEDEAETGSSPAGVIIGVVGALAVALVAVLVVRRRSAARDQD